MAVEARSRAATASRPVPTAPSSGTVSVTAVPDSRDAMPGLPSAIARPGEPDGGHVAFGRCRSRRAFRPGTGGQQCALPDRPLPDAENALPGVEGAA